MATYIYETIPDAPDETPQRFEIQQSMKDAPLTVHPQSGKPVRRVITGGFGFSVSGSAHPPAPAHSCGGGSCGCAHN